MEQGLLTEPCLVIWLVLPAPPHTLAPADICPPPTAHLAAVQPNPIREITHVQSVMCRAPGRLLTAALTVLRLCRL
jgi:hypothetical protein